MGNWQPSLGGNDKPTASQVKLLQELLLELQDCQAIEASELERKIGRLASRTEASNLIDKAIRTLREYQHGGTIC